MVRVTDAEVQTAGDHESGVSTVGDLENRLENRESESLTPESPPSEVTWISRTIPKTHETPAIAGVSICGADENRTHDLFHAIEEIRGTIP